MDLLTKAAKNQKRWISGMNDEDVIRIAEFILREIRNYSENVIETYGMVPIEDTKDAIRHIRETMSTEFYHTISMGHSREALKEFNDRLKAHGIAL